MTLSNTTNSLDAFNTSGNVITMTGAVVDNRVITSTSASFGLVHVGVPISQSFTLSTTGDDNYYTRVTVANGGVDNNGFFTVNGGSNPTFNSASVTDNRTIAGTANTPGVFNGTVTLTTIGEGLPGESPISVPVNYSVQVFSGQAGWIGGSSGSWGNAANWQDQVTPSISAVPGIWGVSGDTATLGSGPSGPVTITLDGTSPHLGSLTFNSTAGYTITSGSGGTLNMDNGSSAASVTVAAGSHVIAAPVVLDSSTRVTVNNVGDTLTVSGPISGTRGLTKTGAGTLVLSAGNTYTGGTTISTGTLALGNGGTTGSVIGRITNNGTLLLDFSGNQPFASSLSGPGNVVVSGPGTVTLQAPLSASQTTVNQGQLVVASGAAVNGDLVIGSSGRCTNNGDMSNIGNFTNAGIFAGMLRSAAIFPTRHRALCESLPVKRFFSRVPRRRAIQV